MVPKGPREIVVGEVILEVKVKKDQQVLLVPVEKEAVMVKLEYVMKEAMVVHVFVNTEHFYCVFIKIFFTVS